MTGGLYAAAAITAGLGVLYSGARMGGKRSVRRAHALLLATVIYLPALLGVMVVDRKSPSAEAAPSISAQPLSSVNLSATEEVQNPMTFFPVHRPVFHSAEFCER
jgi:hypothetical protein